jgi:hypothetical protein
MFSIYITSVSSTSINIQLKLLRKEISYLLEKWRISLVLGTAGFLDFVHSPVFWRILQNTTFRKLHLFPSSGEGLGDTYSLGSFRELTSLVQRLRLALSNGPNRASVSHPLIWVRKQTGIHIDNFTLKLLHWRCCWIYQIYRITAKFSSFKSVGLPCFKWTETVGVQKPERTVCHWMTATKN